MHALARCIHLPCRLHDFPGNPIKVPAEVRACRDTLVAPGVTIEKGKLKARCTQTLAARQACFFVIGRICGHAGGEGGNGEAQAVD